MWVFLLLILGSHAHLRLPNVSSTVSDTSYSNWMGDNISKLGNKSLLDITIPGTHDSGAFNLTDRLMPGDQPDNIEQLIWVAEHLFKPVGDVIRAWATSQDRTFTQQLEGGIRYFDVRAGWDAKTNSWRAFHLVIGNPVFDLLREVKTFLDTHPKEIVILEVSHFEGYPTTDNIKELEEGIIDIFGSLLIPPTTSLKTPVKDLIERGTRAFVAMDKVPITGNVWDTDIIYNTYANSPKVSEMQSYNIKQIANYMSGSYSKVLFKISWTLTPNADTVLASILPKTPNTLIELADSANTELTAFWTSQKAVNNRMGNILIIDHFQTSSIMATVLEMNGLI